MRTHHSLPAVLAVAFLLAFVPGDGALAKEKKPDAEPSVQPGDTITWTNDVAAAFAKAAQQRKPLMICINSRQVDGGRVEPAAKGLREVVYKDVRVVAKSRKFVCVFLTSAGSSGDYGELRARFGIDGLIVSPQHIFAHPDHKTGDKPLFRKEYWPYGKGDGAVKALLDMMDKSLAAFGVREGSPATPEAPKPEKEEGPGPDTPVVPDGSNERKAWIQQLMDIVKRAGAERREAAVRSLVANDKGGDCTDPLVAIIPVLLRDKMISELTTVVRGLTVPGLEKAALAIHELLKHKDERLRANAIVTLEYIGSKESIKPLTARAAREKSEEIANHIYRALGRCGAGDSGVRQLLLKKAKGGKSDAAAFGPIVGLAYFHKDAKAARGIEKQLKAIGPGGGRGGWSNALRRALFMWALAQVADPKSGKFVREKMIAPLEGNQGPFTGALMTYYENVARVCETDSEEAKVAVDGGIQRSLEFAGGSDKFQTAARKDRDQERFEPKAEWEVEGRDWRGGRGMPGKGGKGGKGG